MTPLQLCKLIEHLLGRLNDEGRQAVPHGTALTLVILTSKGLCQPTESARGRLEELLRIVRRATERSAGNRISSYIDSV